MHTCMPQRLGRGTAACNTDTSDFGKLVGHLGAIVVICIRSVLWLSHMKCLFVCCHPHVRELVRDEIGGIHCIVD